MMTANHISPNFFANLLDCVKDQHTDLLLSPGGVSVHKSLKAKLSPLLTSLLTTITLVLLDVESNIVEKMVELVFSGRLDE